MNEYLDRGVSLFEAQRNNEMTFNDAEQQDRVSDHGNRLDQIIESDSGLEILTEARMTISAQGALRAFFYSIKLWDSSELLQKLDYGIDLSPLIRL